MATLQPNSPTLHQTEPKIYKLHTPVPLSTHKCQIKMIPEPKQPQITLVDTHHPSIGSESRNALNKRLETPRITKPHYHSPRNAKTKQHESTFTSEFPLIKQRWPTPALGRPHSNRIHRITKKKTQTERLKSQNLVSSSTPHTSTKRCHNNVSPKLTCSETQCECEWESSRASGDVGNTDARDIHSHGHGHGAYGLAMARI